jgi:hypothetical protein
LTFITDLRRIGHCWCQHCALCRKSKVIVGCFGLQENRPKKTNSLFNFARVVFELHLLTR